MSEKDRQSCNLNSWWYWNSGTSIYQAYGLCHYNSKHPRPSSAPSSELTQPTDQTIHREINSSTQRQRYKQQRERERERKSTYQEKQAENSSAGCANSSEKAERGLLPQLLKLDNGLGNEHFFRKSPNPTSVQDSSQ